MKLKSAIVFFSIIFLPFLGLGQSPPYINYKGGDQIPSAETYHVIQDSKGYIWIATACGVSRFDGYAFTSFTLKDGLPDNVIHEIYEDYKGRIWFVSYSGQLSYFYEGKITQYKYNYLMTGLFAGGEGPVKLVFRVDKKDNVIVSVKRKGAFSISNDGQVRKIYRSLNTTIVVKEDINSANAFLSFDADGKKSGKIEIRDRNNHINIVTHKDMVGSIASHMFALRYNDKWLMSLDTHLYFWDGNIVTQHKFKNPIIWISSDKNGLIWVSEFNGGVSCYNSYDYKVEPILRLFEQLSITSVLRDREGGYWFTTYANGLFYVSNIFNKTFFWDSKINSDSKIVSLGAVGHTLWVGFDNAIVGEISNNRIGARHSFLGLSSNDLYFNSIVADPNSSSVWLLGNSYLYNTTGSAWLKKYYAGYENYGKLRGVFPRAITFYNNKVCVGTRHGCLIFENKRVVYDSYKTGDFKSSVTSMALCKDGTFWLGCSDGLWMYKNGQYTWLGEDVPFFRNRISRVVINPIDSTIWVGTRGGGVGVYNGKDLTFITTDHGLPSDIVNSLAMGPDRVWVGTPAGVAQVSIVPDHSGKYTVSNFDRSIGIVSNEIVDLIPSDSTLIIGTRDGILSYKLENAKEQTTPKVIITQLSVNGVDMAVGDKLDLHHSQNNLSISFAGFTFKTLRKTLFRYRLHESDSTFVYTQIPTVLLTAIAPGNYTFEVWAQNAYGQWSVNPAKVVFSISPPFWTTPWFIFFISVSIFLTFSLIFAYRLKSIKQRNLLSRRLDGWKQQALLQQMNPHFIFNTLNSIQLFILQNDTISSHRYLTKFAQLMRLTLENSQSFSVLFSDELEALRLYLELESLRADGKFTYEIIGDESLPSNITLPSLIIQPFVENAIWHGVMPKGSGGKIVLTFRMQANRIFCSVEDNGIGRVEAEKYASAKAHKSLGSKITLQRLQLLKSMYGQQLGIIYFDLKDSSGTPIGTRVELAIPILPKKVLLD